MGNAAGGRISMAPCCAEETARFNADLTLAQISSFTPEPGQDAEVKRWSKDDDDDRLPDLNPPPNQYLCCKEPRGLAGLSSAQTVQHPLETLSYTPVRFDESQTFDVERSHARYSKVVVHSTRARTQKRSKVWEDWLRGAVAGRPITLLQGLTEACGFSDQQSVDQDDTTALPKFSKVSARYSLNRGFTKLSIEPCDVAEPAVPGMQRGLAQSAQASASADTGPLGIMVDNIQVICPATDFMLLFEQVNTNLNDDEKLCAILLQYIAEDTERKRVCFLEESEAAKDRFVQALTALWLEKRNDHSMWF